jgi:ABC-2 type transport system permease protein
MSIKRNPNQPQVDPAQTGSVPPAWWLVASKEIADLWVGGKVFILLILFSILLGVLSFLLATDIELRLIPPREMVFLVLQITIAVGLFIGLIFSADSISGERERATLEGLLLTPVSRRQIVFGKFLAAVSPWPAIFIIFCPYLVVLSPDAEVLGRTLIWGALLGTLLILAFTGLGMLLSIWSDSNKSSLTLSLVVYLLFLIPTQLPGTAKISAVGKFIQMIDPLEAGNFFLTKVIVNNQAPHVMFFWLWTPVIFAALVLGVLFGYASSGLRLEGGRKRTGRSVRGPVAAFFVSLCLTVSLAPPIMALQLKATMNPEKLLLQISANLDHKVVKTGDRIEFSTLVTYNGTHSSPPLIVAMNIVNLKNGDPVDPEDWSPERAQYIEPLFSGRSVKQNWTINAILEGDYMAYMVIIPEPDGTEATSQPIAASGIHLLVKPFLRINPGGVLPLAIGMPVGLSHAGWIVAVHVLSAPLPAPEYRRGWFLRDFKISDIAAS